jgi:hypothetical protein
VHFNLNLPGKLAAQVIDMHPGAAIHQGRVFAGEQSDSQCSLPPAQLQVTTKPAAQARDRPDSGMSSRNRERRIKSECRLKGFVNDNLRQAAAEVETAVALNRKDPKTRNGLSKAEAEDLP